ncbi:zinc finger protein 26-like [Armigeres subalbatus]|uniref:zinc finger protein 26-like n=1 Tax=Armigeres subalbatus TaxID=124917 RepID=UPI002ED1D165
MTSESEPKYLAIKCFTCFRVSKRRIPIFVVTRQPGQDPKAVVLELLEEHFWFARSDFRVDHILCEDCWKQLSEFNRFYLNVKRNHATRGEFSPWIDDDGVCFTCLVSTDDQTSILMAATANELSLETVVSELLVQHFGFKLSDFSPKHAICRACLNHLVEFHSFYLDVKQNHASLEEPPILVEDDSQTSEEEKDEEEQSEETEDQEKNTEQGSTTDESSDYDSDVIEQTDPLEESDTSADEPESIAPVSSMGKKEGDAIIQAHMHFSCTICNDKCDSFVALKSHMVDKHDAKACVPCCGKNYHHKRDLLLHAIDMRDRQTFRCGRCYRKFETKERKERHMKGHENKDNRAYKCKKCGKTFAFRGPYKDHLNETHGKADIFVCKICDQTFTSNRRLQRHTKTHKGKTKEWYCKLCEKTFTDLSSYSAHMGSHTGPTVCEVCGETCANATALSRHQYNKHSQREV